MLNFAIDAWTSPNHNAFVAITVHFANEHPNGASQFVLDMVEVPCSHSGRKLAQVFHKVVEDFGIEDKVCGYTIKYICRIY
jgi:hypothetical protein